MRNILTRIGPFCFKLDILEFLINKKNWMYLKFELNIVFLNILCIFSGRM